MNGDKILVDTNIFIHLLNRHPKISEFLDKEWWFNFITEIELLGKPGISKEEVKVIEDLLSICTKVPHGEDIDHITIALKQKYAIKTPDAIIAATSIYLQIPLVTFDKGMKKIAELDLILLEGDS